MNNIEIIGGGTVSHVRNHLALTAPAYGQTARQIYEYICIVDHLSKFNSFIHLTKMANNGKGNLETNEDISKLVDKLIANPETKIIFFNPALVDYRGSITTEGPAGYEWNDSIPTRSGKYEERLKTSEGDRKMLLVPAEKIVGKIRKERKDIFLVAFKTTCGASEDEQFLTGLNLLKTNSCNLVLANDTKTRMNMIITPEQARYCVSSNREEVLRELVKMALARSQLTFTRSTIVEGSPVSWSDPKVPETLRTVVNHCIAKGAYPTFDGKSCGHFAVKIDENTLYTSIRQSNYNKLNEIGLVKVITNGANKVIAYGFKPSVGACSQRIIFKDHPEMDCITHFHFSPKNKDKLSVREQKFVECGSHSCGQNTSNGLRLEEDGIKCVYLDNHGPNIVFNSSIDPKKVINFIDKHFDFKTCTDGIIRA